MRAVIFDFDGTIADSFGTVVAIAYHLTKKEQLSNLEQVKILRDNNASLTQAIKSLNIPKWQWPWLMQRGRRMMAQQIHQIPLFPGLDQVLRNLWQDKFQLYILSTNSTSNVERFLVEKGLLAYFDKIYGGAGLFDKAKVLSKVLKQEKLDPASVVYVGDEVRDIIAAKQTGMPCIAVAWGYNSPELLVSYAPMVVTRTPQQLQNVVIEWGKTL